MINATLIVATLQLVRAPNNLVPHPMQCALNAPGIVS